jgi:hypothetical protein
MIQLRGQPGFLQQARPGSRVGQSAGGEDFQSDVAIEPLVMGAIDDAHAAFAQLREDSVVA